MANNMSGKDRRSGDTGKTWSGKGKPLPQKSAPTPKSIPPKTGKTWSGGKGSA